MGKEPSGLFVWRVQVHPLSFGLSGSYPDFFPPSRLRFGWVTSHLSLVPVIKKCDPSHLSHFWEECDALAHENIFFQLVTFWSHPSRKTSHFGPADTKLVWTGRNVTIQLGLKHVFLFPSQICHLSRKREAGRPFGLRPTLIPRLVEFIFLSGARF